MTNNKFINTLVFILFVLIAKTTTAQLSQKHFIPPLTNADSGSSRPNAQFIYISTPSVQNVSYTITQVGSNDDITGVVSRTTPVEIEISNQSQLFVNSNQTSTIHNDRGFIIEAVGGQIYVSVRALAGGGNSQAGALVSKGAAALGTTFRAGMYTNENPQDNYLNFISVMATEDNTKVNFSDLPAGILIKNFSGGATIPEITLNEGESYIVATNSNETPINRAGLIGTLIQADKNIVVNAGSANGSFGNGGARDYGIDQIVDVNKIGTEYIFVRGSGTDQWENVLIVAHEDDTEIRVGNNAVDVINSGEFRVLEGNFFSNDGNMFVQTSKPVFAYQGIGGLGNNGQPSEANQGMFFVPPLSCESRGNVDNIALIDRIGNITFNGGITIVANTDATVLINDSPINNFNPDGPNAVEGNAAYVTYKVTGLSGNISVTSTEELYCAYFNQNGNATSGSFYSGFLTAPEINFNTSVVALGNCIPNVTLEASNTTLFDSFRWEYFNEITGLWEERSTQSTYQPIATETGRYRLVGNIICNPNEDFISSEIPVSICPDDYDGDLIIDNLDVDLDNDGILNCDESIGNASINFNDTDNPLIIFQDNSTSSSIISSVYAETDIGNSFIGSTNGFFESLITTQVDSELEYTLNFTQNINFRFSQNDDLDHIVSDGEFFILKVGPSNKNVTLLDPDNQLLVDTNFDGEFESGVTNISSSEIHFKYVQNTTAAESTFQFLANQVNQISFQHKSTGISATSRFNGKIELTCFSLDSDGDGIENMFDLDSDNDGIPDIIEAFGQEISISGTDTNLDGLDDIFTSNMNLDSDNDGIANYIDIDSDNDGIFDTTEAGHNLDTDFDGRIDNGNSLIGINGLVDNLETVADVKVLSINYTIANTDNDLDFNFTELDADNDNCFDVNEAGFTDINKDGVLDSTTFAVDENGKILNNLDGYTNPNINYITEAPIVINTTFEDVIFCESSTSIISIDSTADAFQWEISTDNGVNFTALSNNGTYSGVNSADLQITNVLQSFNNHQFRVILNRTGNSCSETSNAITLSVNPLPVLKLNPELNQCISVNNNNPTVNLTNAAFNITETPNVTFLYFEDAAGTNPITEPTSYPVQVNIPQSVFVEVTSTKGCTQTLVELRLDVAQVLDNNYNDLQPPVCDDFLDSEGNNTPGNNSDTDGITNFSLDRNTIEAGINAPANTSILYYESIQDRANTLNEIDITNYRNDLSKIDITTINGGIQFPIYYRIVSTINNSCAGLGQFFLQVNSVPTAEIVLDLELCDDVTDGDNANGIAQNFNLETQTASILGTQNATDFTVTYHLTAVDANSGNGALISPFENTIPNSQEIFVRVTNNITGCFTSQTSFNVIVNPVPLANLVPDLEVCDDDADGSARNGFSQNIDLESQTLGILGTQDANNFNVTYHRTFENAQSGDTPLVTPYSNLTPNQETIFIRIVNTNTGCANTISNFRVIVNPEPEVNPVSNLSYCDDAIDGDDTNGIIQNIDLESQIPALLGAQDPDDFIVTFHSSPSDATSGTAAISSPYTNTNSTETIFVRIENKATGCINDDGSFDVIVNPLPNFTITTPQIICLNATPLTISAENPAEIYNYEWRNANGDILGNSQDLEISVGGNYTVTATTTDGTNCSRVETITINESNPAVLLPEFVTIVDEGNNIGSENNLSINIDTINNNLGIGDYQFALRNDDKNTTTLFQDEPIFENLEGGIYTIIVNDKNGCKPDATLQVSVIQFPKFFTPNGDGTNDTWVVKGANREFYPNSSINIFNRFGKLVAQIPLESGGWNGMYNGKLLSSDDYWYNITLIPADNTKPTINKKGHFSLLRR
ncbi:T9SS type B sorting domain-containing protein [uncultured Polaribacter sp.]|uniref:T9SS type B sorting domain-containing protein n=1 Tax=uncultured Polaribacter sp. TaxID=174711 RepID=UPI002617363B|nr:T9SS type B sorting domain-containing protein [uncultured Polaribacter sp.]